MKRLNIVALFLVASTAACTNKRSYSRAAAEFTEVCDGGVINATTPSIAGPNIAVTNCEWPANTALTLNSANAVKLVVSGGNTLGYVSVNLGSPMSAFELELKNGFSAAEGIEFMGELPSGSSITITNCYFSTTTQSIGIYLYDLYITGTTLSMLNNVFNTESSSLDSGEALSIPVAYDNSLVTISNNVFISKLGLDSTYYAVNVNAGVFKSSSFVANNNTFVSNGASEAVGFWIRPSSFVNPNSKPLFLVAEEEEEQETENAKTARGRKQRRRQLRHRGGSRDASKPHNRALQPAGIDPSTVDWASVTDDEARTTYGKSTFVISGNSFSNFQVPWSIRDNDGADYTLENNIANATEDSMTKIFLSPSYSFYGNYYPLVTQIRNNTIACSVGMYSQIELSIFTLPVKSSLFIEGNTVVTDDADLTRDAYLVGIRLQTLVPRDSLFAIRGNHLLNVDGSIGISNRPVGVFVLWSNFMYVAEELLQLANSSATVVCSNYLFGVEIDTEALAKQTVQFEDGAPFPIANVSNCESPTTDTTSTADTTTTTTATTAETSTTTAGTTTASTTTAGTTTAETSTTTASTTTAGTTTAETSTTTAETSTTTAETSTTTAETSTTTGPTLTTQVINYATDGIRGAQLRAHLAGLTVGLLLISVCLLG